MFFKKIFSHPKPDFLKKEKKEEEEGKVIWTEKKPAPKKKKPGTFFTLRFKLRPIMGVMLVSMLIGAIAGGFAGYYAGSYFLTDFISTSSIITPQVVRRSGSDSSSLLPSNQDATMAVEQASPSVVSIIVTKEITTYYGNPQSPLAVRGYQKIGVQIHLRRRKKRHDKLAGELVLLSQVKMV